MVIVLPSQCTGGTVNICHGDLVQSYDLSAAPCTNTTVLAWYADTSYTISPITSGYRLALWYDLVHTTLSLRPALLSPCDTSAKVRKLLCTWDDARGVRRTPAKLVWVLGGHCYPESNLDASFLTGRDAYFTAILKCVGAGLGFRVALASWDHHEIGYDDGIGTTIGSLVDLDGKLLTTRPLEIEMGEDIPEDEMVELMVCNNTADEEESAGSDYYDPRRDGVRAHMLLSRSILTRANLYRM